MTPAVTQDDERAARVAARQAERIAKAAEIEAALVAAQALLKPPTELSAWGIVKTRLWSALYVKLHQQTRLKRKCAARIRSLIKTLARVPGLSADECNDIHINLKAKKS